LPFLISLFAIKIWKVKALPILIFPVGVWFSAVYLGEHYVIDILGGILYAVAAFVVVESVIPFLSKRLTSGKQVLAEKKKLLLSPLVSDQKQQD
jgi:membrane-associated phospholipid phosphatase